MNANLSLKLPTINNLDWKHNFDTLPSFETDKRRYPRYQAQQEVTCTFYNALKDDFETVNAIVENKNEAGLLLITNRQLEPGMPIFVRLKSCPEKNVEDELQDGLHAYVAWCGKLLSPDERSFYQIGLEYFELCQKYLS